MTEQLYIHMHAYKHIISQNLWFAIFYVWHVITKWQRAQYTITTNANTHWARAEMFENPTRALRTCLYSTNIPNNRKMIWFFYQIHTHSVWYIVYVENITVLYVCHTYIHRGCESCISTHLSGDHYTRWFIVWRNNSEEASYQCHLILGFLHKIVTKKLKSTQTLCVFSRRFSSTWLYPRIRTCTDKQCLSEILSAHFSM